MPWLLSRPEVAPVWHTFVNHPFVLALGNGELPLESFKQYLVQDYLYLVQFARANALASYKAKNIRDIAAVSSFGLLGVGIWRCVGPLSTGSKDDYMLTSFLRFVFWSRGRRSSHTSIPRWNYIFNTAGVSVSH